MSFPMTPQSAQWIEIVLQGAAQLGIDLDRTQAGLFSRHAALLLEWNRKINLTAIVDPARMAVKHYLDAVAPLNHIPAHGRLLDIGTGAGFPGIPLKIMRPEQPMTLIDGVRKKISFVKQAIRQLELPNIEAIQIRAEALAKTRDGDDFMRFSTEKRIKSSPSLVSPYDVIVCRALTDLQAVITLADPLLAPNGCIVAYQGPGQGTQPEKTDAGKTCFGYQRQVHAYQLPILGDARKVTILQKI